MTRYTAPRRPKEAIGIVSGDRMTRHKTPRRPEAAIDNSSGDRETSCEAFPADRKTTTLPATGGEATKLLQRPEATRRQAIKLIRRSEHSSSGDRKTRYTDPRRLDQAKGALAPLIATKLVFPCYAKSNEEGANTANGDKNRITHLMLNQAKKEPTPQMATKYR
jgi:hypothetical protein